MPISRHQVEEGTQRAKARTVGFAAGGEQPDTAGILGPIDLDLAYEAEPVGEARAASLAQKSPAFRQEQTQLRAVSLRPDDMGQPKESQPNRFSRVKASEDGQAFFFVAPRPVKVSSEEGVPAECAEHETRDERITTGSDMRDSLFEQFECIGVFTLTPREIRQVREGEADAVLIAQRLRYAQALLKDRMNVLCISSRLQHKASKMLKRLDQTSSVPAVSKESDALLRQ